MVFTYWEKNHKLKNHKHQNTEALFLHSRENQFSLAKLKPYKHRILVYVSGDINISHVYLIIKAVTGTITNTYWMLGKCQAPFFVLDVCVIPFNLHGHYRSDMVTASFCVWGNGGSVGFPHMFKVTELQLIWTQIALFQNRGP